MISKEEWNEFHHKLVQEVTNFLKDKEIDDSYWMFSFTIDDLKSLKKYGEWTPLNDSYMGITDKQGNELIWEM